MIKSLQEVSQDIAINILGRGGLYTVTDSISGLDQHLFNNAISLFNHLTSIAGERYFNHAKRVLKFGIVNTPAMGGFACVGNQDIDFIGINYGSISLISSLFARMLSNELILKEVGEPALEDRAGFASYIPGKADLDTFDSRRPSCAIRTAFAKHLALTALTFIFSHEVSHIVKGHLQVISAAEGKTLLFSRLPLTPLEKQAVELDADCGAIEWTLEYTELIRGWREKLNVESDDSLGTSWRAFYEDPLQTIRFTFFASYLTLRVISGNIWHPELQISIGQPLPPFRMGLLMKLYAEALGKL